MTSSFPIVRVAVPTPLRRVFDYLLPPNQTVLPGARVWVPFRGKKMLGVVLETLPSSTVAFDKLKTMISCLDEKPILSADILQLCVWAADYYHYPLGEALEAAMPVLLRQGKSLDILAEEYWNLTPAGCTQAQPKSTKQADVIHLLKKYPEGLSRRELKEFNVPLSILKVLQKKDWAVCYSRDVTIGVNSDVLIQQESEHVLNEEQQIAVDATIAVTNFKVFLLHGITGSGKTEVYLQSILHKLTDQQQVLVLLPEIGLTPQTIQRFRERFAVPIVALHSGLSDKDRLLAWMKASSGAAKIVIGTRSAIFTPFKNLSFIIVDEEHDLSFKQHEGFRYHARDLAIYRAQMQNIPIMLGSATPSLESLHNAHLGRFQELILSQRAGVAAIPEFKLIDIRNQKLMEGISNALLQEIKLHLTAGDQVMLFLNRRGFAPVFMCHACGWMAICPRCEMRMTYHQYPKSLHCHHCDKRQNIPHSCANCQAKDLQLIGLGTERLETALQNLFPQESIARIDRDSTQRKGSIEKLFADIHSGAHTILIGTQMLAKGHHFPNVTLVAIVDADGGFFSSDFRAIERMGQLILQVSGRAGRLSKPGTVLIQTHHPDHPLLQQLVHRSYSEFAESLLKERAAAQLPPFSFLALFRAEAHQLSDAMEFLQAIKALAQGKKVNLLILGPAPAPMPKRAGRFRVQLLFQSKARSHLQHYLKILLPSIEKLGSKQRVRWSIDIDPAEMY